MKPSMWLPALCVVFAGAAVTPAIHARTGVSLDVFAWLEGDWERKLKNGGSSVESWKRVSDDTMEATATITRGDSTRVFERLRLERFGNEIFYVAKPVENPLPTPFKLVESDASRFVFENLDYDFPRRIIYTREGESGLHVRVEGVQDGQERRFDVSFVRSK